MTNDQHRRGAGTEALTREYISRCLTFLSQAEVAGRRGLRVLAINHDTLRVADQETPRRDLFKELVKGDDVRMAVMTPKMLVGPQMTTLLRTPEFLDLVRWMSVDESPGGDLPERVQVPRKSAHAPQQLYGHLYKAHGSRMGDGLHQITSPNMQDIYHPGHRTLLGLF
ncbi:hypothetical protein C8J57DRAFT_1565797 [Mycena rebaudengoi]|nr:hypothetical protein C8J57DRAFT_1565797 [Mycena rebaudengoi]